MKKQHHYLMLLTLIVFLLAFSACVGGGDNSSAPSAQESGEEVSEAGESPAATDTPAPPPVETPTRTKTSSPTDTAVPAHTPALQPTDTPGPTKTPGPVDCSNNSRFVADLTVPDDSLMEPGEAFTKRWRIQNNGGCTWTMDYQFVFIDGDQMSAPPSVPLATDVHPGEDYDVAVSFIAPTAPGSYQSRWQLRAPAGDLFGERPYVRIIVPSDGGTLPNKPLGAEDPLARFQDWEVDPEWRATELLSFSDIVHVGDEWVRGWPHLSGDCFTVRFLSDFSADDFTQPLTLDMRTYGAESDNRVLLNNKEVAVIPPQGSLQPNWWTEARSVPIPTDNLVEGENALVICSAKVEIQPSFPGDVDDFLFQNLRLYAVE